MTIHSSSKWHDWLFQAQWWYDFSYHSAIKMTPFQVLYGCPPPYRELDPHETTSIAAVEEVVQQRAGLDQWLQLQLEREQNRMK